MGQLVNPECNFCNNNLAFQMYLKESVKHSQAKVARDIEQKLLRENQRNKHQLQEAALKIE